MDRKEVPSFRTLSSLSREFLPLALFLATLFGAAGSSIAQHKRRITWTNTGGSAWIPTSAMNWSNGSTPGPFDIAEFDANPTGGATIGINMSSSSTNNGTNNQAVGAIYVSQSRTNALTVNNSSTTAGTLTLNGATVNGISDVILLNNNGGAHNFTIQDGQSPNAAMALALGDNTNNNVILDGSGNSFTISDIIKSASGTTPLTFQGNNTDSAIAITGTSNTFTGTITLSGPEVDFTGAGSFGNANNTIVINGGRLGTASGAVFALASTHAIEVGASAGTSLSVASGGSTVLSYNGVISDLSNGGILVKQGAGTLALGGASTFSGNVSLNNGTIQLTTGANRLPTGTTLDIGQSASANLGTLDLNAQNQQVAGLNSVTGTSCGGQPLRRRTL